MAKRHFMVRRKRDANHAAIVAALHRAGVRTFDLSGVGGGCPDIACWNGRDLRLIEIKTEKGALKQSQERSHQDWPVHVVRSVDEALAIMRLRS